MGSLTNTPRETSEDAVRDAALRLLERARRTRRDLARRLGEKGFEQAAVERVLDRLGEVGLVDDAEYARAYLAGRWGRRAAGWRRLERELRQRGVTPTDIATARERFEQTQGPVDEVSAARRVIEQAERRYASLDARVRKQRLFALLGRRGFDAETIAEALRATDESR